MGNYYVKGEEYYVFADHGRIYYVGEAGDLYRRVYGEHCRACIGSSEGVVRFLMYLLDSICGDKEIMATENIVLRERFVKERLRRFITGLTIYIGYCRDGVLDGKDREKKRKRKAIEECLKRRLKPLLNP